MSILGPNTPPPSQQIPLLEPVPLDTMFVLGNEWLVRSDGGRICRVTMSTSGGVLHGWMDEKAMAALAQALQMRAAGLVTG